MSWESRLGRARWRRRALRCASVAGLVGLWYVLVLGHVWQFDKLPLPSEIVPLLVDALLGRSLTGTGTSIYHDVGATMSRIAIAFSIAAFVGVPLGLALGTSRSARDWASPAIELLRPIPPVAWVPMAILAIGAQELGVIFVSFVGAVFPIILNTTAGVLRIDPVHARAIRNLGASRRQAFREVALPGALPSIVTGLSVGLGLAWMANVGGEMITGQLGLGSFTFQAFRLVNQDLVIVGMIFIGTLGALTTAAVRLVGRRVMVWQPPGAAR